MWDRREPIVAPEPGMSTDAACDPELKLTRKDSQRCFGVQENMAMAAQAGALARRRKADPEFACRLRGCRRTAVARQRDAF